MDDYAMDEECDFGDLFCGSEFAEKSGLKVESFANKANLVEFDAETKIAHFFPSKTKGNQNNSFLMFFYKKFKFYRSKFFPFHRKGENFEKYSIR